MRQAGNQSAKEVKKEVSHLSHAVFDIVTENEQNPHVCNQMAPTAMQEHICEKRPEDSDPELINIFKSRKPYLIRNQPVPEKKCFCLLVVKHENLKHEYTHIEDDKDPIDNGYTTGRNGIAKRDQRVAFRFD
jgi:hypothetical protein